MEIGCAYTSNVGVDKKVILNDDAIVDKDKKTKFKMIQNVVDNNDGLKNPFSRW